MIAMMPPFQFCSVSIVVDSVVYSSSVNRSSTTTVLIYSFTEIASLTLLRLFCVRQENVNNCPFLAFLR